MGPVETAVVKSISTLLPVAGKKIYSKRQQSRISALAETTLVADKTFEFIDTLNENQIKRLKTFAESPQFGQLALQAMTSIVGGYSETLHTEVREQLRLTLSYEQIFASGDLLQATDAIQELLYSSIYAIKNSTPGSIDNGHAAAMAARMATAAARNSELLRRIDTLDSINEFARKMSTQMRALHAELTLPNVVAHAKTVSREKLYIEPRLKDIAKAEEDDEEAAKPISLTELLEHQPRLVILGDPGAGKSTLTAKLSFDLANNKGSLQSRHIPLLFIVRNHTHALRSESKKFLDHLHSACEHPYNITAPADAIEYLLLNGRATVIIDGVDELGDTHHRTRFIQMVESFANLYPLTRIIVTSRAVGYPEAPLNASLFPSYRVMPFDESQVQAYATKWFRLDASIPRLSQDKLALSFMEESSTIIDLRSNPLMLSLLCVLYSSERFIPQNKPEIYHKCAEVLFETWDRSRGITVPLKFRSQVKPAVQRLAWKLFNDPEGRQSLPKNEIQNFLTHSVLREKFDDMSEAEEAANEFLEFCAGRAWVLSKVGGSTLQPLYGFTHRTFLEYFTAAQLVKQQPSPEAVWPKLRDHIGDASWDVVSQLAVQILDRDCDGGGDHLLELLIEQIEEREDERPRHKLVSFGVRCLDVIVPKTDLVRKIVDETVRLCCSTTANSHFIFSDDEDGIPGTRDLLLTSLLSINSSENEARIIRAAVDSIENACLELPRTCSAGFVHAALRHELITTRLAPAITRELSMRPVSESAEYWHSMMDVPTPQQITDSGLKSLYLNTRFGYHTRSGCAHALICCAAESYGIVDQAVIEKRVEQLEHLYETLTFFELADYRAMAKYVGHHFWSDIPENLDSKRIDALNPTTRAALLILLIPKFSTIGRNASIPDERISWIATARQETARQTAAIDVINNWQLPELGHRMLTSWLMGASSWQ